MSAAPAIAQFETATIVGTVRDASGAVVPGTTVTLTNTATGVAAARTTGVDGSYEFFTVKDGIYVICGCGRRDARASPRTGYRLTWTPV
jgi:hypothetical protein